MRCERVFLWKRIRCDWITRLFETRFCSLRRVFSRLSSNLKIRRWRSLRNALPGMSCWEHLERSLRELCARHLQMWKRNRNYWRRLRHFWYMRVTVYNFMNWSVGTYMVYAYWPNVSSLCTLLRILYFKCTRMQLHIAHEIFLCSHVHMNGDIILCTYLLSIWEGVNTFWNTAYYAQHTFHIETFGTQCEKNDDFLLLLEFRYSSWRRLHFSKEEFRNCFSHCVLFNPAVLVSLATI